MNINNERIHSIIYYCEISIKDKDTFLRQGKLFQYVRIAIQLEYLLVISVMIGG